MILNKSQCLPTGTALGYWLYLVIVALWDRRDINIVRRQGRWACVWQWRWLKFQFFVETKDFCWPFVAAHFTRKHPIRRMVVRRPHHQPKVFGPDTGVRIIHIKRLIVTSFWRSGEFSSIKSKKFNDFHWSNVRRKRLASLQSLTSHNSTHKVTTQKHTSLRRPDHFWGL